MSAIAPTLGRMRDAA